MSNSSLHLFRFVSFVLPMTLCLGPALQAQTADIPMEHNGWGRFAPGAWQHATIATKSYDKDGKLVSTATTSEHVTLISVRRGCFTLRIESLLEVGGKSFEPPVRTVTQGCHGEQVGVRTTIHDLGEGKTTVDGKSISCRVREYEIIADGQRKRIRLFYSSRVAPYVLHSETQTTIDDGGKPTYQTTVQVVALDRPHKVLDKTKSTCHLRTIKQNGKSDTTKFAVHAKDVPGEVVSYTSEERSKDGNLIRQSTMELVDYGYSTPDDELQITRRRDWHKYKRRNRRGG